jgi:hypothetical protein
VYLRTVYTAVCLHVYCIRCCTPQVIKDRKAQLPRRGSATATAANTRHNSVAAGAQQGVPFEGLTREEVAAAAAAAAAEVEVAAGAPGSNGYSDSDHEGDAEGPNDSSASDSSSDADSQGSAEVDECDGEPYGDAAADSDSGSDSGYSGSSSSGSDLSCFEFCPYGFVAQMLEVRQRLLRMFAVRLSSAALVAASNIPYAVQHNLYLVSMRAAM